MEQSELKQLLQRYSLDQPLPSNIELSELSRAEIDPQFLLTLLPIFSDATQFSPDLFDPFGIETIIDYIRKTHRYYLTKKLPEIEQSIAMLQHAYPEPHPLLVILDRFYYDYKRELTEHIEEEEHFLLPYIGQLLKHQKGISQRSNSIAFSLQSFVEHHHNAEKDLRMVCEIIESYEPPVTNQTPYRILVSQLQTFEIDLAIHALIEDKLLIPRAMKLEDQNPKTIL